MAYDESILSSLRRITRAIDLHSRKLASEYRLTAPQLVCLRQINAEGYYTPSQLAREVSLSQATVTGIIDRLERGGLVERRRDHKDRRRVSIYITEKGKELVSKAPMPLQEKFAGRLERLDESKRALIDKTLKEIVEMMEAADIDAAPVITTGNVEAEHTQVEEFLDAPILTKEDEHS